MAEYYSHDENAIALAWRLFIPKPYERKQENTIEARHRKDFEACPCNNCKLRQGCASECVDFANYRQLKPVRFRCLLQRLLTRR